jgi:zinc/manganese transport system substrate-binding protein
MKFRSLVIAASLAFAATPALAAVNAVASFSILGDMVKRIGGERVAVTTIVGPNADTHVYEPKPADAIAVAGADIFFVNGLGFEGWMDRFVESTGYKGPVVVATDGIATHTMEDEGEVITDPHAWQSLSNGLIYADNIAAGLCGVDAEGCETYKTNAAAYKADMSALDAEVRAEIADIPEAKRKVITTHDAFGYFAEAYGVTFLAPEGVSTESEASAQDVAKLIEQIRAEGVSALFIENMSDPRLLEQIASETGVAVGGELYADALSEADGPAPDYLSMFRYNVAQLIPAMRGG